MTKAEGNEQSARDRIVGELKAKGVELHAAVADDGDEAIEVIFRRPSQAQLGRYMKLMRQQDPLRAGERLVGDVVVWPEPGALAALFKRKPGIIIGIAGEVMESAGGTAAFETRRL